MATPKGTDPKGNPKCATLARIEAQLAKKPYVAEADIPLAVEPL